MAHEGLQALPRPPRPPADDAIDALADLFLGEALAPDAGVAGRIGPDHAIGPSIGAPVEAVVLGHLPVLGSAWAPQYARTVAERLGGPVALARLTETTATIELIADPRGPGPADDLDGALRAAGARAVGWVVAVTQPLESLADRQGLASVVVLTGADDAAVVACYTALKAVAGAAGLHRPVRARVAIMGAADADAQHARQRIESAAARFLGLRAPVLIVPRLAPVVAKTLYRGPCADTSHAFLDRVCAAAACGRPVSAGPSEAPALRPPSQPTPVREAAPRPEQTETKPAARETTTARDALHHAITGLVAIPIRCPYATGVELAIDAQGGLHAVAGAGLDAVEQLLVAVAWADDHAEILEAADARIDPGEPCVGHLVTSDPARAARLLRTPIRVHLADDVRANTAVSLPAV